MTTGLLLGAGASFELGLPLVWNLTAEFKGFYTREQFTAFCRETASSEVPISDEVRDVVLSLLAREDMHYESILGYLQTAHRRPGIPQHVGRQYHNLYTSMVNIVYALLYHRQVKNPSFIERAMDPFEGLAGLVPPDKPLWIFSLNHDVMIEILAERLGIPLKDGFWNAQRFDIPNPDQAGNLRKNLTAELITASDLDNARLDFFNTGPGINLFKLHGALNTFAVNDKKDLCRLVPTADGISGFLEALWIANEELGHWINGSQVNVNGFIVYTDATGEMQFLRRTLLAGAQKFTQRYDQTLPHRMLELLGSYINHVTHLYVLGYSFGDPHVDQLIRRWLEFGKRRMTIVDPHRQGIPTHFQHLAPEIEIVKHRTSDFFLQHRATPLNRRQKFERILRDKTRTTVEKRAAVKWPKR